MICHTYTQNNEIKTKNAFLIDLFRQRNEFNSHVHIERNVRNKKQLMTNGCFLHIEITEYKSLYSTEII